MSNNKRKGGRQNGGNNQNRSNGQGSSQGNNRQANQQNNSVNKPKYNCETHGPNPTHNTAQCRNRDNNNNQRSQAGRQSCNYCKKSGHVEADCRNRNRKNSSTMDVDDEPSAGVSAIPYCEFCNVLTHVNKQCTNIEAVQASLHSVLVCKKCKNRGHLTSDCKNPVARECYNCGEMGHTEQECQKPEKPHAFAQRLAAMAVPAASPFQGGPQAMAMRRKWDYYQNQAAAEGRRISDGFRGKTEMSIIAVAAQEMLGAKNIGNNVHQAPIQANVADIPLPKQPSFNPEFTFDPEYGLFLEQKAEKAKAGREKELRDKVERSKCYSKVNAGAGIRLNETWIMENKKLTRRRFGEVKMALAGHNTFWRDPGAMNALCRREQPRCNGCQRVGCIFDAHFNIIDPLISAEDILDLEDTSEWGLFVGFQCLCSGQASFNWYDIPKSELARLEEEKKKASEAKK